VTVYTRPIATADRLVTKYGGVAVLTRSIPGAYNPATGMTAAATVTTYTVRAFRENYALKDVDGTLVKQGDVRLLMNPNATNGTAMAQPATATDTILFDGTTYAVIGVDPFDFAGESVAFYVQCRGV
jgi:hypothetical protein